MVYEAYCTCGRLSQEELIRLVHVLEEKIKKLELNEQKLRLK